MKELSTHLLVLAEQLMRAGNVPHAIDAYRRLLAVEPALPDSWYNLAYLQHRARDYAAALISYDHALAHGVSCAEEVHLNRSVILAEHLGRPADALTEINAALALNSKFVPAWINLGNLHEQSGARVPAQAAYQQALAIEPSNAVALSRLPNVIPKISVQDPLISQLRAALRRSHSESELADLGFGLGKALDSAGAYDEAFAAYVAANQVSRRSAGPRGACYDRLGQEALVDRMIHAFSAVPATDGAVAASSPPVFICGMFRSGSTLVEQILASHPRVTMGGELDLLPTLVKTHIEPCLRPTGPPLAESTLREVRRAYLEGIAALYPAADVLTDKRPDNFLYIGLIKQLFPQAKIVHTRRDPIDNCLSVFFLHLSHAMPYALDLLDTAHWYGQYTRLMTHWKSMYGDDILDIDYDALVVEPRTHTEQLLRFLALDWDDACLAFHQTPSVVMTPSAWQVREPLYTRSSGRWRNYERHLTPLRKALAGRQA